MNHGNRMQHVRAALDGVRASRLPAANSAKSALRLVQPLGSMATLAIALQAVAGVIHLSLAPAHLAEAIGTGLFFLAFGTFQVVASAFALRKADSIWFPIGVASNLMGVGLWGLTRWWRDPFSAGVEAVDLLGAATTGLEVCAAIAFWSSIARNPEPRRWWLAASLVVGLLGGPIVYGVGVGLDSAFPALSEGQAHDHGDDTHDHAHAAGDLTFADVGAPSPAAQALTSRDSALRRCSLAVAGLHCIAEAKTFVDERLPESKYPRRAALSRASRCRDVNSDKSRSRGMEAGASTRGEQLRISMM